MQGVYVGNNRVLTKILGKINFVVPSDDLVGTSSLIMDGVYEPSLTNFILKNIRPGMTCFDVGANIGYFTTLLGIIGGPSGRVLAFEANPSLKPFIKANINMHYMGHHVRLIPAAVFDKECDLILKTCTRVSGNSSLFDRLPGYEELYDDEVVEIQVRGTTLDAHAREFDRVDFVKMDIEGAEYDALTGFRQSIDAGKVGQLVLEWNLDMLKDKASALLDFLRSRFSQAGVVQGDGSVAPIAWDQLRGTTFVPSLLVGKAF